MRTQKEIEEMMDKAGTWNCEGASDVRGMSYEEGVEAALRWATGGTEDQPIENEFEGEEDEDDGEEG